jgi:hypothetical protein
MDRPVSAASINNTTTTNASTHKRTKSAPRIQTGPILSALFLTNLRLLDLDLLPDWPSITPFTFSNVDARARIKGVEWSLYQLFRLLDPAMTAEKLQPFFPPLEPLQSINLRAALYRCLDALKKNGVLGREAVLRKTMLDECSGDKFWEICVALSAVVVRKRVVRKKDKMGLGRPVAQTLGAAQGLRKVDREVLLPLLVAHRVSLSKNLSEKQRLGEEFAQLGNVLQEKEEDLGKRKNMLQEHGRHEQVQKQLDHFRPLEDVLRKGWVGDETFEEALLSGGSAASSDRMLAESTEALFNRDRRSRVSILGQDDIEITEDIVSKARGQNSRLKKWQALYDRLQTAKPKLSPAEEARAAGQTTTRFNRHADLTLGDARSQRGSASPTKSSHMRAASACVTGYDNILSAMREDLRLTQNARRGDNNQTCNDVRHGRSASAFTGAHRPSSLHASQSRSRPHSRSPSLQYSPSQSPAPFRPGMGRRISSRSRSYQQPKVISQRGPIPLKSELFSPLKSARPGNESPNPGFMSRPSSLLPSPREELDESAASIDDTLNNANHFGASCNSDHRRSNPVLSPPREEPDDSVAGFDAAMSGLGIRETSPSDGSENTPGSGSAHNFALPTSSASPVNLDPPKQDPITHTTNTEFAKPPLPFPLSRQPSLADRTRSSMAFTSSETTRSPEALPSPTIVNTADHFPLPPSSTTATSSPQQAQTRSLADRTRQSISSFSQPSTPLARQASTKRPSQHTRSRTSIHQYPNSNSNNNSNTTTPRQNRSSSYSHLTPSRESDEHSEYPNDRSEYLDEEGRSGTGKRIFTPREQLFEASAEYDSVFKSRPKIALSPVLSPSCLEDEGEEFSMVGALRGLDDDYGDDGGELGMGIGVGMEGTPTRR